MQTGDLYTEVTMSAIWGCCVSSTGSDAVVVEDVQATAGSIDTLDESSARARPADAHR